MGESDYQTVEKCHEKGVALCVWVLSFKNGKMYVEEDFDGVGTLLLFRVWSAPYVLPILLVLLLLLETCDRLQSCYKLHALLLPFRVGRPYTRDTKAPINWCKTWKLWVILFRQQILSAHCLLPPKWLLSDGCRVMLFVVSLALVGQPK